MLWLINSQILFCKRARNVGASPKNPYLKRLWLVALATILSKTFTIHFVFMSVIAHNWSFCTKFKQTFWSICRIPYHLKFISNSDPHRNLSDRLQSQARTNVDMSTWCRHVHVRPHCFILTEAWSCILELAYFAGNICKNRLVCMTYIEAGGLWTI